MRPILFSFLLLALTCPAADSQTRRIAAASHSGAATVRDEDNFGVNPEIMHRWQQRQDSIARVDSLRIADSTRTRVRMKR